ncbi:hypothetical protein PVAND_004557 [Polypedilum vanderplanki]|uniref:BRCT domain-containing protein n=1 Tax=Polypedilum vanderplanki TaxID=319348 RepID=A0A9J6BYH4_POLVA|nr:hypothetical protein PVAND_004557 [Polypedilum vanderplanki]
MPQIKNIKIHSFSSEDPNFPAKNLINTDVTKRWKCAKPGEKSAFVVLKLDKPYQITQIDIGNEFSSMIEILVGNSQQEPPDFREILMSTSFMTLIEARNETNPHRLRIFNKGLFVSGVAEKKWDLIKILCVQNYNNRKQYGISFINLFTNDEVTSKEEESPIKLNHIIHQTPKPMSASKPVKTLGKFHFRDSSSDEEKDEDSSPFAKWKAKKNEFKNSTNDLDKLPENSKSGLKEHLKEKLASENRKRNRSIDEKDEKEIVKNRNRSKGLMYESSDDEPNEKLQKKIDKDKELKEKEKHVPKFNNSTKITTISPPKSNNKFASFTSSSFGSSSKSLNVELDKKQTNKSPEKQITKSPEKELKAVQYKPFNKLLEGVIFVLSGYQNPERGVIRQKAIDMGAVYKPDWDSSCTHLVCSYNNTPKYHQVKGKGKIITKKWIERCFTEQKRLPWRRFAVDKSEQDESESEEEIFSEWHKPKTSSNNDDDKESINSNSCDIDDDYDMLIVDKRNEKNPSPMKKVIASMTIDDSESDNDMKTVKIEKSEIDSESKDNNNDFQENVECYSEDSISSVDITKIECEVFKDKKFYLNTDLSATDKILLKDHIKNMLGVVTKNPHKADYIIVKKAKSLPIKVSAEIVKEVWIRECFELQAFIPTSRYRIAKS